MIHPYLMDRSKTAVKYNGKKKLQADVPYVFIGAFPPLLPPCTGPH